MAYRDDLEAERARLDALEKRTEELERENAALRAKKKHRVSDAARPWAPEPSRSQRLLVAAGIAAGVAFVLAMFLTVVVPDSQRLTAPLACPAGYARSEVVVHRWNVNVSSQLWCIFPDHRREKASDPITAAVMFLGIMGITFVAAIVVGNKKRGRLDYSSRGNGAP